MNIFDWLRGLLSPFYSHKDTDGSVEILREVMGEKEQLRGHRPPPTRIDFTLEIGELLAETLKAIFTPPAIPKSEEIKIMANFIVKDDNPDVGVKVTVVGGDVDSEGHPTGDVKIAITSTDDAVVQVTDNGDGSGNVHFGAPGQASTQYSVSDASGNVLGTGSDGFTVTTGDPTAITSITASFDGLTPVEEAPTT